MTVVVGALAVVNAVGAVADPSSGLPWEAAGWGLRRPPADQRRRLRDLTEARPAASVLLDPVPRAVSPTTEEPMPHPSTLNTTIGVVATDAILDKAEVSKLAAVAHDGLARAVRPAHSMVDGDTVFGLATGNTSLPDQRPPRIEALNQLLAASADAFADACTHAVLAATTIGDVPAYRDVCPGAWRDPGAR
jgi:L-aminopeptidase/D-esterase-like protein